MNKFEEDCLNIYRKRKGKFFTTSSFDIKKKRDYKYAMSPGVAVVVKEVSERGEEAALELTSKSHSVAFVTDGSAILGLGDLGPLAGLTIVEGKAVVLKELAGVDGIPIVINNKDTKKIVETIKNISLGFSAIHLEDISAPRCFEIVEKLQNLGIPVYHDDQLGTSIAVYAALLNASKVVKKDFSNLKVVVFGAGAAGLSITRILAGLSIDGSDCKLNYPFVKDLITIDSLGIVSPERIGNTNKYKKAISKKINPRKIRGDLDEAIKGADVLITVSGSNKKIGLSTLKKMNCKPIVFSLSNPSAEVSLRDATLAGVKIYCNGSGDSRVRINSILVYPGLIKAILDNRIKKISDKMIYEIALGIAEIVKKPTKSHLLPSPFEVDIPSKLSNKIKNLRGEI